MKKARRPAPGKKLVRVRRESWNYGRIAVVLVVMLVLGFFGLQLSSQSNGQNNQNNAIPIEDYDNIYKPPEGSPSLLIVSPQNGDIVRSSTVGIRLNVTNFQLADITANRQNVENQGHLLYTLDGREQRGVYKVTSFANLEKGDHTLTVELQNNDKTSLSPRVFATVSFRTE